MKSNQVGVFLRLGDAQRGLADITTELEAVWRSGRITGEDKKALKAVASMIGGAEKVLASIVLKLATDTPPEKV